MFIKAEFYILDFVIKKNKTKKKQKKQTLSVKEQTTVFVCKIKIIKKDCKLHTVSYWEFKD